MFVIFMLQIIFFLIFWFGLKFIRDLQPNPHQVKWRPIDAGPILSLCFIHELTLNGLNFSYVPQVMILWVILGFLLLIIQKIHHGATTYRHFYINLWRLGDLFLPIIWLITGFLVI